MNAPADKYAETKADRQRYIDMVLQSKARKKIVVAGPGTGKTFLFKEILKDKTTALNSLLPKQGFGAAVLRRRVLTGSGLFWCIVRLRLR